MTMRRRLLVGIIAAAMSGLPVAADTPEDLAQAAAESWPKLLDSGDYGGSWERAGAHLKKVVTLADWVKMAGDVRTETGKLVSRKVTSREYAEKLPGAPDGKYVTVQYESVFENKGSAVETVVLTAEPDGTWRVIGAFIR